VKKLFLISLLVAIPFVASAGMRVVSLKPAVTDTIVAMGHGDMLIGVTKYCDAKSLKTRPEIVGDYTRPYVEKILALKPDIVIGSKENSSRRSIETLEGAGTPVALFPFDSMADIMSSTRGIGALLGEPSDADRLARSLESGLDSMKRRWSKSEQKDIIVVWGRRPIVVAGQTSYISPMLAYAGARNAVANGKTKYPRLGKEELLTLDPYAIVDLSMGSESGGNIEFWKQMPRLQAVKNDRIYMMDAENLRPSPRIIDGLEKLAELIQR
jgi:ABC-type Fe3+-hydroxamate transport system substrate-binding protein